MKKTLLKKKKDLIKRLSKALYGKKPGKHTVTVSGAAGGGALGTAAGIPIGAYRGAKNAKAHSDRITAVLRQHGRSGAAALNDFGGLFSQVGGAIVGGAAGGTAGLSSGALLGGVAGKVADKARMAKYLKRRKKTNRIMAASGAGGISLAALLKGTKKKPKKSKRRKKK